MATKTRLVDQPPSASSSEDDEDSDPEEQESESESDPEQQTPQKPQEPNPTAQKPPPSSGSESETESDEEEAPQITPKPIAPPPSPAAAKRPSEAPAKGPVKKKIKSGEVDEKKTPGSAAPRIWSEDDEISVLEAIIELHSIKGTDPCSDISALHEFVKDKLHYDFTKNQIYEKIRRIKSKFLNNVKKGENPDFAKSHDYKVFDLSKKIWGSGGVRNGVSSSTKNPNVKSPNVKGNVKGKKASEVSKKVIEAKPAPPKVEKPKDIVVKDKVVAVVENEDKDRDFYSKFPCLVESFVSTHDISQGAKVLMKDNSSSISSSKAKELEENWSNVLDEEAELHLKKIDLIREYVVLVRDARKKR